jgi:Na+/glutamate symporter
MEKIKDLEVRHVVFDCLHMVMFMSINPDETIDDFKALGREMVVESLIAYNLVLLGQDTFGLIIANLVNKRSPFRVWHNFKPFCYGCIT